MKDQNENPRVKKRQAHGFGRRLKQIRSVLSIPQRDFAEKLDVSTAFVSALESEKSLPAFGFLFNMIERYSINPSWLLLGKGSIFQDDIVTCKSGKLDLSEFDEDVLELLAYFKKSPLVKHVVLGFALSYIRKNASLIVNQDEKRPAPEESSTEKVIKARKSR